MAERGGRVMNLTKNQSIQLRALHTKGLTNAEIAKKLEMDVVVISHELESLRLKPNLKDNVSASEFATKQSLIPDKPKKAQSVWTSELDAELFKLYNFGKTVAEMSDKLGIKPGIIRPKLSWAKKKGLIPSTQPKKCAAIINPVFEKAVQEIEQSVSKKSEIVTPIPKIVPKSVVRAIQFEINRINNSRLGLLEEITIYDKQLEELNKYIMEEK